MTPCLLCSELEPVLTTDTESGFPAALAKLVSVSRGNYRDEWLLECPLCGQIYEYGKWTPGGSDDAMQTYVHESLAILNEFETELWFADSIWELEDLARQGYKELGKQADELLQNELSYRTGKNPNGRLISKQGEIFLANDKYLSAADAYRDALLKQRQRAEQIVAKYRKMYE